MISVIYLFSLDKKTKRSDEVAHEAHTALAGFNATLHIGERAPTSLASVHTSNVASDVSLLLNPIQLMASSDLISSDVNCEIALTRYNRTVISPMDASNTYASCSGSLTVDGQVILLEVIN